MQYPKVRLVYDRRKKANAGLPAAVEIEVYFAKKRMIMSTGVRVPRHCWHPEAYVVNHPDALFLNTQIENKRREIMDWITQLSIESKEFSFEALSAHLKKESQENTTPFIDWVSGQITQRRDLSHGSMKNHQKLVRALYKFGRIDSFPDLTTDAIDEFDAWLHTRNISQATVHSYHKMLKVYVRRALAKGLIKSNPYDKIKIDRGKSNIRRYLTAEQIELIRSAKLPSGLNRVRDMFLFQCATGLAYADMMGFNPDAVKQRNDRHVYCGTRTKTGEPFYIVLGREAREILDRNGGRPPQMTNQQYNIRLKVIAEAAGLDERLTSHMARHSFAVRALNSGIAIEVVAKILGHTDIATTQIYAKILNKSVEDAFDTLDT